MQTETDFTYNGFFDEVFSFSHCFAKSCSEKVNKNHTQQNISSELSFLTKLLDLDLEKKGFKDSKSKIFSGKVGKIFKRFIGHLQATATSSTSK